MILVRWIWSERKCVFFVLLFFDRTCIKYVYAYINYELYKLRDGKLIYVHIPFRFQKDQTPSIFHTYPILHRYPIHIPYISHTYLILYIYHPFISLYPYSSAHKEGTRSRGQAFGRDAEALWVTWVGPWRGSEGDDIALRFQVCPKKGISPTILFDHQSYSREGSRFLGIVACTVSILPWAPPRSLPF